MSSNDEQRWRGGRPVDRTPVTPGFPPGAFTPDGPWQTSRVDMDIEEARDIAQRMKAAANGPLTVLPAPQRHDVPATWERALDAVKNVIVIVTCLVLLYGAWRVTQALAALGDALDSFGTTL